MNREHVEHDLVALLKVCIHYDNYLILGSVKYLLVYIGTIYALKLHCTYKSRWVSVGIISFVYFLQPIQNLYVTFCHIQSSAEVIVENCQPFMQS